MSKQHCRSFDNVAVLGNSVKATFDFVAKIGYNVERVLRWNFVLATKSKVASTLLLVWTGLNAAGGRAGRPPGAWAIGRPTLHGGPVWLRPVRATPCFTSKVRCVYMMTVWVRRGRVWSRRSDVNSLGGPTTTTDASRDLPRWTDHARTTLYRTESNQGVLNVSAPC